MVQMMRVFCMELPWGSGRFCLGLSGSRLIDAVLRGDDEKNRGYSTWYRRSSLSRAGEVPFRSGWE